MTKTDGVKTMWYPRAFGKKIYLVFRVDVLGDKPKHFCNRNAAIMWLKRYGADLGLYIITRGAGQYVRVVNGYVYFNKYGIGLLHTAESKKTAAFATRNN